jgi:hypothetical protein
MLHPRRLVLFIDIAFMISNPPSVICLSRNTVCGKSRDNSVGMVTGYGMDRQGSTLGRVKRFFSSPQRPDRLWGAPSLLSSGYRGRFSGCKRPEREADDSPPSSSEIKNGGAVPPLPIRLHGVVLN